MAAAGRPLAWAARYYVIHLDQAAGPANKRLRAGSMGTPAGGGHLHGAPWRPITAAGDDRAAAVIMD